MLQALELTGLEETKNWTWNKDEYTKWLGHYWKWNSRVGMTRAPGANPLETRAALAGRDEITFRVSRGVHGLVSRVKYGCNQTIPAVGVQYADMTGTKSRRHRFKVTVVLVFNRRLCCVRSS
jgi:hypothetical protein